MSRRYPIVRITPEDVIEFSRARHQQPSMNDAARWLSHRKRCIEEMMGVVIQNNLQRILDEATFMAYPDPAFDRRFREIDDTIQAASDAYGDRMDLELCSSSYEERDMLEVVARIMIQPETFSACIAYAQEFEKPTNGYDHGKVAHRTRRVHLTCRGGKIMVEVVPHDACKHGSDVFVPGRRTDPLFMASSPTESP
jgi:hypothetical protein